MIVPSAFLEPYDENKILFHPRNSSQISSTMGDIFKITPLDNIAFWFLQTELKKGKKAIVHKINF